MKKLVLAFILVACESRSTERLASEADAGDASAHAEESCCAVIGRRADATRECVEGGPMQHLGCVPGLARSCVMADTAGCILRRADGGTPGEVYWTPSESHLDRLDGFERCDDALREQVSVHFGQCVD